MKIDKNKRMIEELNKIANSPNYLRNINSKKQPIYLELDKLKQTSPQSPKASSTLAPLPENFPCNLKKTLSNLQVPKTQASAAQSRKAAQKELKDLRSTMGSNSSRRRELSAITKASVIDEFEMGRKLGQGKFGSVHCARHVGTGGVFAVKKISKSLIKSHMMVDQLGLQLRIQSCVRHRGIVDMYGFFDDLTHFYILLEYTWMLQKYLFRQYLSYP